MTTMRDKGGGKRPPLDLHGVSQDRIDAKLEHFLHSASRARERQVEIVTGRGASSRSGLPVLRKRVEKWLGGNKERFGIVQWQTTNRGGALLVILRERS